MEFQGTSEIFGVLFCKKNLSFVRCFDSLNCIIYAGGERLSSNALRAQKALQKHGDSLMRVAFTYTNNMYDAQDMVQEALLKYIEKAPKFLSSEHEKAWLIRVIINLCKNHMTSAYKKTYAELTEDISVCDNYSSGLYEAVCSLPSKYSLVIHLFYYEGYSQKEIAKLMKITESAVSTRLQRGRSLLREKIGDDFFD